MFSFFTTLCLLALLCALIYVFLVWNFGYWRKRGIKEAKSWPFFGSFPSQFTGKRNVIYDLEDIYRKHRKNENIIGVHTCRIPMLMVLSPEYAHKVFVNDFRSFHDNEFGDYVNVKKDKIFSNNPFILRGEEWKERRAEITPGLTNNRILATFPVTLEVVKKLTSFIREQTKMGSKDGLDARDVCLRYTTEVVSDCVLGIEAKSFTNNPTPIMPMIRKGFDFSYVFIAFSFVANLFPWFKDFYCPSFFPGDVQDFFLNLMKTSIQLRKDSPEQQQRVDFLNYILHLQDKKNLSLTELTSHTMTFLTDGFETTSLVLSHTLLLLARNPDAQEKLRAEIGVKDLSFEELTELPYLDACINETLRIFPPQLMGRKKCTNDYEFTNKDGRKLVLRSGQIVILPIFSLQHDEVIYEEPESFKPERFLPENGGVRNYRDKGAFFGFGDGPRICLGMRFAMVQMKAALVEILRNFTLKVNQKTRSDNCLDDIYFLARLKGGIWLDFEERI